MTYLLVMILFVSGLFMTDGGEVFLSPVTETPKTLAKAVSTGGTKMRKVIIGKDPVTQLGVYRYFLKDSSQCVVSRNQQAIACSAGPLKDHKDQSLKSHQFKQLPYPAPGLHRILFKDGLDCVMTAAKTGLACNWGAPSENKTGTLKSIKSVSTPSGPGVYLIQYTDQVTCVLPKTKSSLWCQWPAEH